MTQQNALEQAINSLKQDTSNMGQGLWKNITSTERVPGTGTNKPIPWGQILQKGWEDVQRNNPVYKLVSNVGDAFGHPLPQAPTLSPLPDYMNYTPGMDYKTKQDEGLAAEAAKAPPPQPMNLTLNYPAWMGYPRDAPPMPTAPNQPISRNIPQQIQPSALQQAKEQVITQKPGKIPGFTTAPVPGNLILPIVKSAQDAGVNPAVFASILFSEHGFITDNNRTPVKDPQGNIIGYDRGIAQINSHAHPEVTDQQAFDPNFAIPWAANLLGRYIKEVQARGGTLAQGIAAYNVGVGGAMANGAGKLGPNGQYYLSKITKGLDPETLKQLELI